MTLTNADVQKALKGSIKKWKAIAAGTGVDEGGDNCPLCQMFYDSESREYSCDGCPVEVDSGSNCAGSPYFPWVIEGSVESSVTSMAITENDKKLAKAELDYLIDLDKKFFGNYLNE